MMTQNQTGDRAIVTINKKAIAANIRAVRGYFPDMAGVIKADAYGLGCSRIVPILYENAIREFFVVSVNEALHVRTILREIGADDFVIHNYSGMPPKSDLLIEGGGIVPVLNNLEDAQAFESSALCTPWHKQKCFLQIDTGMNRLGIKHTHLDDWGEKTHLFGGVLSHLACGSSVHHPKNARQRDRFLACCARFPDKRPSLAATTTMGLGPDFCLGLLRAGICLYGFFPSDGTPAVKLAPAVSIKAPIIDCIELAKGETVSYNANYIAEKRQHVAVIGIGYADGYPAVFSNCGAVFYKGRLCPILGDIAMDYMMVDVTTIGPQAVQRYDMVELLGPNITMENMQRFSPLFLFYNLLTALGPRVERRLA